MGIGEDGTDLLVNLLLWLGTVGIGMMRCVRGIASFKGDDFLAFG